MAFESQLLAYVLLALLVALVVSFLMTPVVKTFAYKVGAIDVPKDNRRMHKKPIPRLGGMAIVIGFLVCTFLFVDLNRQMWGVLLGAFIILVMGVVGIAVLAALFLSEVVLLISTKERCASNARSAESKTEA